VYRRCSRQVPLLQKALEVFQRLKHQREKWSRRLTDSKELVFDGSEFDVISKKELEEQTQSKPSKSHNHDIEEVNRYEYESREVRHDVMSSASEGRLLRQATDNPNVMSDILDDPSWVDADCQTEAVAKVAAENPSWAKMSELTDMYDIDIEAGDTSDAGDTDPGSVSDSDMAEVEVDTDTGTVSDTDTSSLGNSVDTDLGGNTL
jgi:hypothetical protein